MYYISENNVQLLDETFNFLNQLTVHGANNAYALANAFARLEQIIKDIQDQKNKENQPIDLNKETKEGG
jgi:hypothetical protein